MGKTVHLLDTVSGNIRSLVNAIEHLGYTVSWIRSVDDFSSAERIILPGVGHFGHCLRALHSSPFLPHLLQWLRENKPFMGICVGLQALFEGSEEAPGVKGLGVFKGTLRKFDDTAKSVPHIGWNSAASPQKEKSLWGLRRKSKYYYVHSFSAPLDTPQEAGTDIAAGKYGDEEFVGAISRGNIFATQFHPEKSGVAGLRVLKAFLDGNRLSDLPHDADTNTVLQDAEHGGLTRRVIACLDVRANDDGDLVVTKGDQYDVREKAPADSETTVTTGNVVRNLGKPVDLATRYYEQGADEITFLNITSFRNCPLADTPLLHILRLTARNVFVPLTIGGGIRDLIDPDGTAYTARDVAARYFHDGADKVSIGSDAVSAAEQWYANGKKATGSSSIEQISQAYGAQAVVVSIDPRRIYVSSPEECAPRPAVKTKYPGPNGEEWVWYQTTIHGGRTSRPLSVQELAIAVEALGAGEILLNSIDRDGSNRGFDLELVDTVKDSVKIPVIASSGAGNPGHFVEVFRETRADAALGAGMFHRGEYSVKDVKEELRRGGLVVREVEGEI